MRILLVGGGSGGHVTPLKAIVSELNTSKNKVYVVTDRSFFNQAKYLFSDKKDIKISKIFAGKFRRYHSKSVFWHILHLPTLIKNVRDLFYIVLGLLQSIIIFIRLKPDVVFCKGGFVCIPVGVIAKLFNKRILIHDSDTRAGLTNRILSRWAETIATGMPTSFYNYPKSKMIYVGMPVDSRYTPISDTKKNQYKNNLGFKTNQPVLLVTGGGNGSENINKLLCDDAQRLLKLGWGIEHIVGNGKAEAVNKVKNKIDANLSKYWHISEFTDMLPRILASDIVISRTSATTLQECANSKKAVIGIPSKHLLDQTMNAQYFSSLDAILYLDEKTLTGSLLADEVIKLQNNPSTLDKLSESLNKNFSKPKAANQIAQIILN